MFVPRTISSKPRKTPTGSLPLVADLPSLADARAQPVVPRTTTQSSRPLSWTAPQTPASPVSDAMLAPVSAEGNIPSSIHVQAAPILGPILGPLPEPLVGTPTPHIAFALGASDPQRIPSLPPQTGSRTITAITGYRESPTTASMTSQGAREFREANQMEVQGKNIPKPIMSFEDCNLPAQMLINLVSTGYVQPRPVQMQMIPIGLRGSDMLICAETGSGKTAGFLVPTLMHVYGLSQSPAGAMQGPFAIILTPTRELAMQIEDTVKSLVAGMPNMRTALLTGGQAMSSQVYRLKQNIHVVVATPGRLVDIFSRHPEIEFSNVFCLIMDEVDMMFSLGFSKQVKRILDVLPQPPNGRQTLMCSATISRQIQQLSEKFLQKPIKIRIGNLQNPSRDKDNNPKDDGRPTVRITDVFSPSSQIKQTVLWVENGDKKKQLFSLLNDPSYFRPPVLVFVESRVGADLLANAISTKCQGITAVSIHGEKPQEERTQILKSIVEGSVPVVVATGLLARGLNLNVAMVINFDMAPTIQEYVHRVGRANPEVAAKASIGIRKGPKLGGMAWAITFINNDHKSILSEFANMLSGLDFGRVTPLPPQLKQLVVPSPSSKSTGGGGGGGGGGGERPADQKKSTLAQASKAQPKRLAQTRNSQATGSNDHRKKQKVAHNKQTNSRDSE